MRMVSKMMVKPEDSWFRTGSHAKRALKAMEVRTTPARTAFPLDGGITTARNMP